jgi:hypothetical protein
MDGLPKNAKVSDELGNLFNRIIGTDFIGSTIKRVYTHYTGASQVVSSYDSGELFVIEYITADGREKCFSITDGNIIYGHHPTPLSSTFFLSNKETLHYIDNNSNESLFFE